MACGHEFDPIELAKGPAKLPAQHWTAADFKRNRILVVGDVMLDRYYEGTTLRISPEAPVPVVRV